MKALIHLMIIVLALASFSGCRKHSAAWPQMDIAESVMEESPDSAMSVLAQIDADCLTSAEEHARFALLLSEALVKQGYLLTDDSIARVALDYYEKKTGSEGLMKALFFNADIADTNGEYGKAIEMLLEAKEIANDRNNDYWYAKIVELMGDVFSRTFNFQERSMCALEAADYYKRAGKERNHRFAMVDYAYTLSNAGQTEKSVALIDSIMDIGMATPVDSMLISYCEKNQFYIHVESMELKNFSQRERLGDRILDENHIGKLRTSREYSYLAKALLSNGELDKSFSNLMKAQALMKDMSDSIAVYWELSHYFTAKGDMALAKAYCDSVILFQNIEVERVVQESAIRSQRDFFVTKAKESEEYAFRMSLILTIVVVCILSLSFIGYIVYKFRIKVKDKEIEARIQDVLILTQGMDEQTKYGAGLIKQIRERENRIIELEHKVKSLSEEIAAISGFAEKAQSNMLNKIEEKDDHIHRMQEKIALTEKKIEGLMNDATNIKGSAQNELISLFRGSWSMLNVLCNQYFEKGASDKIRYTIIKDIEAEIDKLKMESNLERIEDSVNKYMDGAVDKMRRECTFLKPDDITFLTLVMAGFSPRAICLFRNLKLKNFYMKKKRLMTRIEASDVASKGEILKKLQLID